MPPSRGRARALGIFDHLRVFSVHDGDAGVGRSQVNTNNFSHVVLSLQRTVGTRSGIRKTAPNGMVSGFLRSRDCADAAYIRTGVSDCKAFCGAFGGKCKSAICPAGNGLSAAGEKGASCMLPARSRRLNRRSKCQRGSYGAWRPSSGPHRPVAPGRHCPDRRSDHPIRRPGPRDVVRRRPRHWR